MQTSALPRSFLVLIAMAAFAVAAQAAAAEKPGQPAAADPVAKPRANAPTISVAKTEASEIAHWQPAMGEGLAHMFITELNNLPNFKVLESVALEDLRTERKLGENGEIAEGEAVKKGEWKGADYTFKSTVTRFGNKENRIGGGGFLPRIGGDVAFSQTKSEVQIDWRIIDNQTREVMVSGRGVGTETGGGFSLAGWGGGGGGHAFGSDRQFLDSALGKATMKAIREIVAKVQTVELAPGARAANADKAAAAADKAAADATAALRNVKGVVKMVENKDIWVSLGAKQGFAVKDKVKIYKPIEKKNKKGEVVATTYELVGEITLTKVQKDKSMGEYSGSATISEDWAAAGEEVDIEKLGD